jgi:hypothetical protein
MGRGAAPALLVERPGAGEWATAGQIGSIEPYAVYPNVELEGAAAPRLDKLTLAAPSFRFPVSV